MKLKNITLGLAAAAAILIAGCYGSNDMSKDESGIQKAKMVTEASLGLRKTDLYTESTTTGNKTMYGKSPVMSGYKIKRAYQDAPPMIPHDVEGLLPITTNNNQCIGCHDVAVASSMGATPLPKSHYTDFRPKHNYSDKEGFSKSIDNMKNEISIKPMDTLSNSRFNCTQCHTPQSTGKLAVENTFEATYTKPDGDSKSSWYEVMDKELDTLKK